MAIECRVSIKNKFSKLAAHSCRILKNQPTNYFSALATYGMLVDSSFRIIMSDDANLRWNIVKSSGPCGGWYGIQELIDNGLISTPMSYVDDVNNPDYFFEVYNGQTGDAGVWYTKKDGTSRVQIFNAGSGSDQNPAGGGFDKIRDRVVWTCDNASPMGGIRTCKRDGSGLGFWNIWALFSYQPRGVGVFDDGRYILTNQGSGLMRLYTAWGGTLIQSVAYPSQPIWYSCDNINNRVYCSNNSNVFIWDIASNSIVSDHVWGGASQGQSCYREKDGFVYSKIIGGLMKRWSYSKGISESWTGAQYKT